MRLQKLVISAVATTLLSSLTGCANYKNPSSSYSLQRFAVPEIAGESWQSEINVGGAKTHKVVLPAQNNQKPVFTCNKSTKCDVGEPVFVLAGLSVIPGLAFYINGRQNRVSATWQYAGDYAGQASTGNFSQALVLGYSKQKDNAYYGDATFIGDPNETLQWDQATSATDFGWVGGYRLSSKWLVYGGPFVILHDIDLSSNYTDAGDLGQIKNPDRSFKGKQIGANAAVQYQLFRHMNVSLELVRAKYRIEDVNKTNTQVNLMMGFHF